jgi:hypothetical protein
LDDRCGRRDASDAVPLARILLDRADIRAAEAVLEASDAALLPRVVTLLEELLTGARASIDETPSAMHPDVGW